MAQPNSSSPAISCDIGVFIALKEEFRVFQELIGSATSVESDNNLHEQFYLFQRTAKERTYQCVAAIGGQMGEGRATRVIERMLARYSPKLVVVLGIAGALDRNLRLCDVVVGDAVDSYLEAAKAVARPSNRNWLQRIWDAVTGESSAERGAGDDFVLQVAGEPYRTSSVLKNAIDNLEFSRQEHFRIWVNECSQDLKDALSNESPISEDLARESPQVVCGAIASGPIVGAAPAFAKFLKSKNRKYVAIEMESGGVLGSTHERVSPPLTLIIRGVSDFGDERKAQLDNIGGGVFRRVAMRNAVRLLWCTLESGGLDSIVDQSRHGIIKENAPSGEHKSNEPGSDIAGCNEIPVALHIESAPALIGTLKTNFEFVWEPASYRGTSPIVFWPVRLRKPTPIHALQTFAAAAIQSHGGEVILCLDDLGNREYTESAFFKTAQRWWSRAGMTKPFQERQFSQILAAPDSQFDAWPIVQRWLGVTEKRVLELLRISKIVKPEETDDSQLSLLRDRRPRRLLNPAVIWACLAQIAEEYPGRPIITLGGYDERPLWEAWRNGIVNDNLSVGHLYNPCLGDTPLHMSSENLGWDCKEDIEASLRKDVASDPGGWLKPSRMVPWCLRGCIALPDFLQSGCSRIREISVAPDARPEEVIPSLARALDDRLFGIHT